MDWLKLFGSIFETLLPIAAALFPGGQLPALVLKLAPAIPALMGVVEEGITEVGNGALKKSFVMSTLSGLAGLYDSIATGGAKTSFEEHAPLIGTLIDATVKVANTVKPGIITNFPDPAADPVKNG